MRTLEQEWAIFREQAIPRHAPSGQLQAMREAFMGGAAGALQCLADDGEGKVTFSELAARIKATHAEIERFVKSQVPNTLRPG
jgi:hypothetical protein